MMKRIQQLKINKNGNKKLVKQKGRKIMWTRASDKPVINLVEEGIDSLGLIPESVFGFLRRYYAVIIFFNILNDPKKSNCAFNIKMDDTNDRERLFALV